MLEDPDAWASRDCVTREHVDKKVARIRPIYNKAIADEGSGYKNRVVRQTEFEVEEQERYDNVGYDVKRSREYPNIGDQLDALYHAGAFPEDMATKIKAVKDKYPKE